MEYITDREELRTHGIYKRPHDENISVSKLKQLATELDEYETVETSNRAMWPEKKVIGIKSKTDSFKVYTDHIKIICNYDELEEIYESNKQQLQEHIDIPVLESFYVSIISLYPTDLYDDIYLDETKIPDGEFPETNMHGVFDDRNEEYIPLVFKDGEYTIKEAIERVDYMFENEFVYYIQK